MVLLLELQGRLLCRSESCLLVLLATLEGGDRVCGHDNSVFIMNMLHCGGHVTVSFHQYLNDGSRIGSRCVRLTLWHGTMHQWMVLMVCESLVVYCRLPPCIVER